MRIGWIGLGEMGRPMVRNLLNAGHEVAVYNRTRSRADALRDLGAVAADSPAEAGDAEVVFTMLWDDRAVEDAVFGEKGILSAPRCRVHVGMSTVSPRFARRLAEVHAEHGQDYISAPVFGRPWAAEEAKLGIVVAGSAEAINRVEALLSTMGAIFRVGQETWQANLIKLTGNFMIGSMLEILGEGFALTRKAGIDREKFLDVVNGTVLRSPVYESYGKRMIEENYENGGLLIGLKDLSWVREEAVNSRVPMPVAALVQDRLLAGFARGYAELDWSVIAGIIAEDAGLR